MTSLVLKHAIPMRFSLQSHGLYLCQAVPENPTVPTTCMGMAVNVTGFVQLKTNTKIKIGSEYRKKIILHKSMPSMIIL